MQLLGMWSCSAWPRWMYCVLQIMLVNTTSKKHSLLDLFPTGEWSRTTRAQNVGFEEHLWWQESMHLKEEDEMMSSIQFLPPAFCVFFLPFIWPNFLRLTMWTSSTTMKTYWEALISRMRFLVAQREPLRVKLGRGQYSNENYIVLRNLSGHRPGARAWFVWSSQWIRPEGGRLPTLPFEPMSCAKRCCSYMWMMWCWWVTRPMCRRSCFLCSRRSFTWVVSCWGSWVIQLPFWGGCIHVSMIAML